jgi:uncharacterized membrane protein
VSALGTAAGAAGALGVALLARALQPGLPVIPLAVAGVAGMLADSVLGATVQARFTCAACGRRVETARHCDAAATRAGGWRWMTNDTVNAIGTGTGAAVALLVPGG